MLSLLAWHTSHSFRTMQGCCCCSTTYVHTRTRHVSHTRKSAHTRTHLCQWVFFYILIPLAVHHEVWYKLRWKGTTPSHSRCWVRRLLWFEGLWGVGEGKEREISHTNKWALPTLTHQPLAVHVTAIAQWEQWDCTIDQKLKGRGQHMKLDATHVHMYIRTYVVWTHICSFMTHSSPVFQRLQCRTYCTSEQGRHCTLYSACIVTNASMWSRYLIEIWCFNVITAKPREVHLSTSPAHIHMPSHSVPLPHI